MEWEWEKLDADTYRARVFSGWLVQALDETLKAQSMCFVPDPCHEWEIGEENAEPPELFPGTKDALDKPSIRGDKQWIFQKQ